MIVPGGLLVKFLIQFIFRINHIKPVSTFKVFIQKARPFLSHPHT